MKIAKIVITLLTIAIIVIAIFFVAFLSTFNSKFNNMIIETAEQLNVDYTLCLAIAKAESKFDEKALSRANAIGIMQIKLDTANYMQQIYGNQQFDEKQLFVPQNNILCGVEYIAYLFSKFDDVDAVICAYNAGETTVRSWLNNSQYSSDQKTLSQIPYKETEAYLKKVKFNQNIYKKFYG